MYARFNKNFLHVSIDDCHTAFDHDLILNLLCESQRRNTRLLKYSSERELLYRFVMGSGKNRHEALRSSLKRLRALKFSSDKWYVPRKGKYLDVNDEDTVLNFAQEHDITPREAKLQMKRFNKPRYKSLEMGCISRIARHSDGSLTIVLDKAFYSANTEKKFYVEAYLEDSRKLRTLPEKRLLLIMRGLRIGEARMRSVSGWSKSLHLQDGNTWRWKQRLLKAVESVEDVRNGGIDIKERKNGVIALTPLRAKTGQRGNHAFRHHTKKKFWSQNKTYSWSK